MFNWLMQKNVQYRINPKIDNSDNRNQKENVDINMLLNRVRINKKNDKIQKIVLFSFGILLLSFVGIFVSNIN